MEIRRASLYLGNVNLKIIQNDNRRTKRNQEQ